MLSQREAATQWHLSRNTVQRAIRTGKLSLTPDKRVDPAEMLRVFGEPEPVSAGSTEPAGAAHDPRARERELEAKVAAQAELLAAQAANLSDLRAALLRLTHEGSSRRWWWQR